MFGRFLRQVFDWNLLQIMDPATFEARGAEANPPGLKDAAAGNALGQPAASSPRKRQPVPLHVHTLGLALLQTAEQCGALVSPDGGQPLVQMDAKRRKITITRLSESEVASMMAAMDLHKSAPKKKVVDIQDL